jgi:putative oxidoreductase
MSLVARAHRLLRTVEPASNIGPLLARLVVGIVFVSTGWGKLHNHANVTDFFTTLNIPLPGLNAWIVASIEFFGGLALIFGLATRLAALPMAGTMVVAIITAKRDDIEGLTSLLGFNETLYFAIFVWLAVAGPGMFSADFFIRKRTAPQ